MWDNYEKIKQNNNKDECSRNLNQIALTSRAIKSKGWGSIYF